jgi:hypothetical protein
MAAAEITEKVFNYNGEIPVIFRFTKATTADWVVFGNYPGVLNCRGTLYTGADEATLSFGTAAINNSGTAYSATSTSIVIGTAAITRVPPYYIQTTSGEIILVLTDSAPTTSAGTLTVQRGCLGTTASLTGLAHTNTVYILNIVVFGAATTGVVTGRFTPMPTNPGAQLFATDGS